MDDMSLPEFNREDRLFQKVVAQYDAPAFVRRASRLQEALQQLHGRCQRQRDEWFADGRLLLEELSSLLPDWGALSPFLAPPEQGELFPGLQDVLAARARFRNGSAWQTRIRLALRALIDWIERFNRRWTDFLGQRNLTPLNELRENYNRYYVLEKECALRSARLAHRGFVPLTPYTLADLLTHLPPLPVPQLAS